MTGCRSRSAAASSSISLVQNDKRNRYRAQDPWLVEHAARPLHDDDRDRRDSSPSAISVTREAQDEYALRSQQRTAAAQQAGRFDEEIVAAAHRRCWSTDRDTGETSRKPVTLDKDEGNRPTTTLDGLAALKPVFSDGQRVKEGQFVTAGNASQLSDGASAVAADGGKRKPNAAASSRSASIAAWRSPAARPDEMGIGPVFAVPKLLAQHGLTIDDIDLWELNEAFAVQVLYCRDRLGIDPERSMSTAARSRSAIPTACRARAWSATR